MTPHDLPPPPETMLAHRHFIRGVVRSLLRGADGEDDVVQQALVRAWQSGPRQPARLRPWLARIARNLAIDHLRAANRRRRNHESVDPAMAPPKAQPSTADVLQREEERQRVVHAVLALPEPYRATVLLRFWDEMSTAQIARQLGVPGATIRSRLKRGLALLRERLDADYGGRGAWLVALAPFAAPGQFASTVGAGAAAGASATGAPAAMSTMGTLLMTKSKYALAAAVLLVAGVMTWLLIGVDRGPAPGPSGGPASLAGAAGVRAGAAAEAVADSASVADAPSAPRVAAADPAILTVRGETEHRGAPYPDLGLRLQWFAGVGVSGQPEVEYELRSDREGRFEWRGPQRSAIGTVRVVATDPDVRVADVVDVVEANAVEVHLRLSVMPLRRSLFGRVLDSEREAIAGARLTINRWAETEVVTGSDGRYEIRVPEAGFPLIVTAEHYQSRLLPTYMPDDAQRHELDIELVRGGTIQGRVVDSAAAPIAGAAVTARDKVAVSDGEGRFELHGVPPDGESVVSATKRGFQRGTISAQPGEDVAEIVLVPGVAIALRVVDQHQHAVVGARVYTVKNQFSGWRPSGWTAEDGRLRLEDLAPDPFDVIAQKTGFVSGRMALDPSQVGGPAHGEVVIVLRPGQSIRGRVVDTRDVPIPGASIYCRLATAGPLDGGVGKGAVSDANGQFEVLDLPPDAVTVVAAHLQYSQATVEGVTGGRTDLVMRMEAAPSVAGRVIDGLTGQPLDAFEVRIASDSQVQALHMDPLLFEQSDGYWRASHWRMKPGAELFVEVLAKGYAPARVRTAPLVDAARDHTIIRLFAGTTVTGVVRDARTGQAIPDALLVLEYGEPDDDLHRFFYPMRPMEHRVGGRGKTDAAGRFSIDDVAAGPNRLILGHAAYPETTFGPFDVARGTKLLHIEPELQRGATLRGRVRGIADAPGLVVAAYRFGQPAIKAEVAADLSFALTGLGPGDYRLMIRDATGRLHRTDVAVGAQDLDGIVLAMRSGTGSIRGTVHGLDSGQVQVARIDGAAGQRRTVHSIQFDNGVFLLDGIPPGRYRIVASSPRRPGEGRAEAVVGDGEAMVTIEHQEPR